MSTKNLVSDMMAEVIQIPFGNDDEDDPDMPELECRYESDSDLGDEEDVPAVMHKFAL